MGPAFVANSSRNFVMSTTSFVLTPTLFKLYYPQEQKSQVLVAAQSRVSLSLFVLLTAACAPVDAILVRAGVQHLRRQLASRRLRAAERLELTLVIDRLWRRFLERLDTIYDTC